MYEYIIDRILSAIQGAKKDVLNSLTEDIVSKFRKNRIYPAGKYPRNISNSLSNAILGGAGSTDEEGENFYERKIFLPYANILLSGYRQNTTMRQRVFFHYMYKKTKDIKWLKMKSSSQLVLRPMDFVNPSIKRHSRAIPIIVQAIRNQFGKK